MKIESMRRAGRILAIALEEASRVAKVGMTGKELDAHIAKVIADNGGEPAFLGFQDYPAVSCISVNDVLVHGLPDERPFQSGDVIGIDVGVRIDGWNTDAATTIVLPETDSENLKLVETAWKALDAGIALVRPGVHLGDIQHAMQEVIEASGYGNITSLTGHGIGQELHEDPSIPTEGKPGTGPVLEEGMTFCLEPMITRGGDKVATDSDGWSIRTADGSISAHVEHTILVTQSGAEILSRR